MRPCYGPAPKSYSHFGVTIGGGGGCSASDPPRLRARRSYAARSSLHSKGAPRSSAKSSSPLEQI
eukprot:3133604-Prymnesium_polylepis.2